MIVNHASRHRSDRGIALVLTLAFLALITVTVLAFFSSVTTELASSKSYASGASAKELSDSAVNAVIGTIKEATSGGGSVAWTSQPGLLRTYDDAGNPIQIFKLYSSDKMVEGDFDPTHDVDVDWKTKPGLYVDLNQPFSKTANGTASLTYPIVDPAAADPTTGVEGFSLNNAPGYNNAKAAAADNNPAPMPVKWIYMLKDGTMTAPDKYDAVTGIASFTTAPIPTGDNPIVGRMAYWTDDETAKVNINTASEGSFWDTPVCNTRSPSFTTTGFIADPNAVFENDLAEYQGAQKEFQRYPGHPATTCLSTVFQKSLTAMNPSMTRQQLIQMITDITPRVTVYNDASGYDASSWGGTRRAGPKGANDTTTSSLLSWTETFYAGFRLKPDSDRLYASVDELIFKAPTSTATSPRVEQQLAPALDARHVVEQARFFVTAQSRAPELNLFNKPRVAIWPLQVSETKRTFFDKLIAFCASIGQRTGSTALTPYYFTREDPASGTTDWSTRNQAIYKYLQTMTAANTPGYGKKFSDKYPGLERDQILTEIFDYIRCTNLIDYSDPSAPNAAYTPTGYTYAVNASTNTIYLSPPTQNLTKTSRGQVVPIAPPASTPGEGTRGIGRIATISEMALVVIRTGPQKDGRPFSTDVPAPPQDDTKTNLQVVLMPELFCPLAGFSVLSQNLRIRYKNIHIMVDGVDAFNGRSDQNGLYESGRQTNCDGWDTLLGGIIGYRGMMQNSSGDSRGWLSSTGSPATPAFKTDSIPAYANITISKASIKPDATNMTVAEAVAAGKTITLEGSVDVEIEAPANEDPAKQQPVIQSMHFDFPQTTVPIPNRIFMQTGSSGGVTTYTGEPDFVNTAGKRGGRVTTSDRGASTDNLRMIFTSRSSTDKNFDVVRSVVPVSDKIQGDLRIIAALPKIESKDNFFSPPLMPIPSKPVQPYFDSQCAGVHSLRSGGKQNDGVNFAAGGVFGSLVSTIARAPLANGYDAIVPEGYQGIKNSRGEFGDWDNGPFTLPDGPLCNKADEGTERHRGGGTSQDAAIEINNPPYLSSQIHEDPAYQYAAFFSPNKMMPSPVMLGSLPTGVMRKLPWQTLLFRPAVSYLPGNTNHPGGPFGPNGEKVIPDHVLLDLFWMPVVEPYAISEPVATAGKINMNYQIVPFTHIKRDTGLRAVMKSVKITAIDSGPASFVSSYKQKGGGSGPKTKVRYNINMDETLKQFETERFNKKKAFISASEICEIPLVPEGSTVAGLASFWSTRLLTGDNSLERPYCHMYSRLTTKSNTYTVHVWVEVLRPVVPRGAANNDVQWAQWNEKKKDQIVSRYRGSTLIERYIDPQDPALAKFNETYNGATEFDANGSITKAGSLDPFYKFHVLNTKKFGQ